MAKTRPVAQHFSAAQAASFSGLSLAMLNYLCRHQAVVPSNANSSRRGVQRLFSFGDLVVLRAIAKLLSAGVSVSRLNRGLARLRKSHPEITKTGMPASYLVTDGKDVYLRHKSGVVELLSNGQLGFAFVVEMETLRKEAVEFAEAQDEHQPIDGRSGRPGANA